MESERMWSDREGNPTDAKYRNYQQILTDHEIYRFAQEARSFLNQFGSEAVAAKRPEFLEESLQQYEAAAGNGHSSFRGWGILEATLGFLLDRLPSYCRPYALQLCLDRSG
jgi:hypothetical protein